MKDEMQPELHFEEIELPTVELRHLTECGEVWQIIEPPRTIRPKSRTKFKKSRTSFVVDESPELSYLVTQGKEPKQSNGCAGVIRTHPQGNEWIQHKKTSAAKNRLLKGADSLRNEAHASWRSAFHYKSEDTSPDGKGLRLPQIGALHALACHRTLSTDPATIVMPTGTGKTETMVASLVTGSPGCMLVVVPSRALRDQTARKFATLGVLTKFGILGGRSDMPIKHPVVGILRKRPKKSSDLWLFKKCNVVVSVVNTVAQGTAERLVREIAALCSQLVLDEAHHVKARTWAGLKEAFAGKEVTQFTATPYREDRSPVDGKMIYNYPLHRAQKDDFFRPIHFKGVFEIEQQNADSAIARQAIECLRADISNKLDHCVMARCSTTSRSERVFEIYKSLGSEFNPILVHSEVPDVDAKIAEIKKGRHRIVVCVNMLAEGFDFPQLKIAAIHDKFKSLAITLQFTGRFTRDSDESIGDATVIANTGDAEVAEHLQSLYDEDSDWNKLIAELSFRRIEEEKRFQEFLRGAHELGGVLLSGDFSDTTVTPQSIMPRFNVVVYQTKEFRPHEFHKGLEPGHQFLKGWLNDSPKLLFFVTRLLERPIWSRNKKMRDASWHLFSAYFDEKRNLLYIGSSENSISNHKPLATAIGGSGALKVDLERVFRVFAGITRLMLHQVGLLQPGPRNTRYSMFAGIDVREALSRLLTGASEKSNIFGSGYENGRPAGIGCSRKGKIWGRESGPLQRWTEWCDGVGTKLLNDEFDTETVLEHVIVPTVVDTLPDSTVWYIDWPSRIWERIDGPIEIDVGELTYGFDRWYIELSSVRDDRRGFSFTVGIESTTLTEELSLSLVPTSKEEARGHRIIRDSGLDLHIRLGKKTWSIVEFMAEYPPILMFTDQSQLEGCLVTKPREPAGEFNVTQAEALDWAGVDTRCESYWNGEEHVDISIQAYVMRRCRSEGFDIVFDDDGANEIADVVCVKDTGNGVMVRMVHCKYAKADKPGARIDDLVVVTSQAVKNTRWFWNIDRLIRRMISRHQSRFTEGAGRFFEGNQNLLRKLRRISEVSGVVAKEVIVAQPGVKIDRLSPQMLSVLGSADAYFRATIEAPLKLWAS